jgi:cytochrome c oxidase subunit II
MFIAASAVFFAVLALYLYALRRPADSADDPRTARTAQRWIIGGGVLLPLISISALLILGIPVGRQMLPLPVAEGEALRIDVIGHQWWWEVNYPDAGISLVNQIYLPVNTPVDLHLSSADVIHSLWVPRLAGKLDMIPGRVNVLRVAADLPGTYRGQCAEFCGLDHAHMHFTVEAHTAENFAAWLESMRD